MISQYVQARSNTWVLPRQLLEMLIIRPWKFSESANLAFGSRSMGLGWSLRFCLSHRYPDNWTQQTQGHTLEIAAVNDSSPTWYLGRAFVFRRAESRGCGEGGWRIGGRGATTVLFWLVDSLLGGRQDSPGSRKTQGCGLVRSWCGLEAQQRGRLLENSLSPCSVAALGQDDDTCLHSGKGKTKNKPEPQEEETGRIYKDWTCHLRLQHVRA